MLVSTVLPTYNESMNIIPLMERLLKAAKDNYETELIIVDDDSPDKTWEVAAEFAKKHNHKNITVIRRKNTRGLPTAIARGIKQAKGDIITWMDCDLCMPPEIVPKLVEEIKSGADISVGSRYSKNGKDSRRFLRVFTSKAINLYTNMILNFKIKDYNSGFVAAKKEVFDKVNIHPKGYGEYCVKFLYESGEKGFKITEVGYEFTEREKGESKTGEYLFEILHHGLKYGLRILGFRLNRWRYNPNAKVMPIIMSLRSSIRRRYYVYFKKDYVKQMLETRKGNCEGCGGICCFRTRKCPYLKDGNCSLYNTKIPKFCMVFPIDKKDIELAGVEDVCQFYWEKDR